MDIALGYCHAILNKTPPNIAYGEAVLLGASAIFVTFTTWIFFLIAKKTKQILSGGLIAIETSTDDYPACFTQLHIFGSR